jgi:hypothetical protein
VVLVWSVRSSAVLRSLWYSVTKVILSILLTHKDLQQGSSETSVINAAKLSILLRPGAGLGITREEADFGGIWLPGGVGAAGAFPRRWEALRHFGVRALVFGPTPISQSSLVAGVTESIAGSPSSPTEGLKIGRVSR